MKKVRRSIAMLLSLCVLLCGLGVNFSVFAADPVVNVLFNNMDSSARQDMEPSRDTTVKDLSTCTTDYLEGTGAVKFGYKTNCTDLVWYGRVPADYDDVGIDIAGATHMIFDMYVSDVNQWTLNSTCYLNLRSLNSAQTTGSWDTSCGQVKSADLYAAFSNLKNGWNHVVLPIDTSVATETVIWGFQMRFSQGNALSGFYTMIDDIRFVNQAYLDSDTYKNSQIKTEKGVKRVQALMAAIAGMEDGVEARRMKVEANVTYHSLKDDTYKNKANSSGTPYETATYGAENGGWKDNGVAASELGPRVDVKKGDYAFSLAVLNDLHYAVRNNAAWNDVYQESMNWIVNNQDKENIKMAIQLGDLTSNVDYSDGKNEIPEWNAVRAGFDILREAQIPFATVVGNHDRVYNYTNYNTYFPYAEQAQSPYFGGAKDEGRTENLYYTFEVGGMKYMVLTLDVYPDDAELAWADGVIKAHPYHNVIVVTHSYLKSQNTYELVYTTETEDPTYTGEKVWNTIIKNNPNVILTFSAHNEYPAGKAGLGLLQGTNDAGKPVYQFLMGDPQVYERTRGGLGSVAMIRFSEDGKKIALEYISTRYDMQLTTATNVSPLHTSNYYEIAVSPAVAPYTEYTEDLSPQFHLGLSTATEEDECWEQYYYVGQKFVPDESVLRGVSVPLAMTSEEATLHFEIRSELNGAALASNDVKITGKRGEMAWYPLLLESPLTVTANQPYYVVYYLTQRSSGDCVVYGTKHEEFTGCFTSLWHMPSGGTPTLKSRDDLAVGFDIIDGTDMNQPAIDAVIGQINALPAEIGLGDKTDVIAARAAYNALAYYQQAAVPEELLTKLSDAEDKLNNWKDVPADVQTYKTVYMLNDFNTTGGGTNAALSTDRSISGLTSLKMSATAEQTTSTWKTSMDPAVDLTQGGKYQKEDLGLAFWLYVDGQTSVVHMFQMCSSATGWTNGISWNKWTSHLVGTNFNGWTYVVIPFGSGTTGFDVANLQSYRITQMNSGVAHTYYIDDLQVVYIPDYDDAKAVDATINALPQEITLEDKAQVEAARAAYDGLTDAAKAYVSVLDKLTAAETKIEELQAEADAKEEADQAAAAAVIDLIDALPQEITLADKNAVEAALAAYEALTEDQKALVTNLATLLSAKETVETAEKEAALAASYQTVYMIDGFNTDADFSLVAKTNSEKSSEQSFSGDYSLKMKAAAGQTTAFWKTTLDPTVDLTKGGKYTNNDLALAFWLYVESADGTLPSLAHLIQVSNTSSFSGSSSCAATKWTANMTTEANKWIYVTIPLAGSTFDPTLLHSFRMTQTAPTENKPAYTYYVDDFQIVNLNITKADEAVAKVVEERIASLPVKITMENKSIVETVRAAYEALTDAQKEVVTNLSELIAAEAAVVELERNNADQEDAAAAQAVIDAIDALKVQTVEDKAAVVAARAAYVALTDVQKALVPEASLIALAAAEDAMKGIELEAAKDAAYHTVYMIDGFNTDADFSLVAKTNAEKSSEQSFSGGYSLKMTAPAGDTTAFWKTTMDPTVDLTMNGKYTNDDLALAFWLYVESADGTLPSLAHLIQVSNTSSFSGSSSCAATKWTADMTTEANKWVYVTIPLAGSTFDPTLLHSFRVTQTQPTENKPAYTYYVDDFQIVNIHATKADEVVAQDVIQLIDALNVQSLADKAQVEAARAAYDALTDGQKSVVTNLDKLLVAEGNIADLEQNNVSDEDIAAAQAVIDAIAALNVQTVEDKAQVEAARAAYTALTFLQKTLIPEDSLVALALAEDAVKAVELEAAKAAAYQTVYMINGFNVSSDLASHGLTNSALSEEKAFSGTASLKMSAAAGQTTAFWRTTITPTVDVSMGGKYTNDDLALAFWLYVDSADGTLPSLAHLIQVTSASDWGNAGGATKWTANMTTEANKWVYVTIPLKGSNFDPSCLLNFRMTQTAPTDNKPAYTYYLDDFQIVNVNVTKADETAAQSVVDAIEALNVQTLADKTQVEAARAAYDALTDTQKNMVPEAVLTELVAAEEAIRVLEENAGQEEIDRAAAQVAIDAIDALPEELTLDDKAQVEAARAAFEALTDDQKALVDNLAALTAAEAAIAELEQAEADKAAAQAVTDAINALTEESTKEEVVDARAAYEALTESQKALVANETLEKLVELEEKFQEPEITYGDVDGNGKVDAADALKALQHAVKLITLEGDDATAADVNGDDKIDATDALLMLQYTVKLIDKFPVEA